MFVEVVKHNQAVKSEGICEIRGLKSMKVLDERSGQRIAVEVKKTAVIDFRIKYHAAI